MSSNMKDARWELAYKQFTGIAGVDWDELDYPEQKMLLDAAQALLTHLSESEVAAFASDFRGSNG